MKEKSGKEPSRAPFQSPFGKELTGQLAALLGASAIPVHTIHHCGHCIVELQPAASPRVTLLIEHPAPLIEHPAPSSILEDC
jgi:hypothetical protein